MAIRKAGYFSARLIKRTKFFTVFLGFIFFFTNLHSFLTRPSTTKNTASYLQLSETDRSVSKVVIQGSLVPSSLNNLTLKLKKTISPVPPVKNATTSNPDLNLSLIRSLNGSCKQRITEVYYGLVLFKNITIRPKLAHAKVLEARLEHAEEQDEFFKLDKGFFTLYCSHDVHEAKQILHSKAKILPALASWTLAFDATYHSLSQLQQVKQTFQAGHYLAIQRHEYANVYWTIVDLLDIYITTHILGVAPENLNILLIDAHPPSSLDPFWSVMFHRLIKVGVDRTFTASSGIVFENLVWRYPREYSPLLNTRLKSFHLIRPFRNFVLERFGIPPNKHHRNCSQHNINVLVILRRDYQNHPRNLKATIDRKIANEKEVLKEMNESFPNITITAVQLDSIPLKRQLELVASTDIFFGMHGAAHAFSIFMPPGGAVVEIFNIVSGNWHMKKIAALSRQSHITWTSTDRKAYNPITKSTTIPAGIASELTRKALQIVCPRSAKTTNYLRTKTQSSLQATNKAFFGGHSGR